jgi:hypothetical protein
MRGVVVVSAGGALDVRTGKAATDSPSASQAMPLVASPLEARFGVGMAWFGTVALMVLVARWLAYALAQPSPFANRFAASAGGPSLVLVSLVTLALAAAISVAVLWLATVSVRERQRLRPDRVPPHLRLRRLGLKAVGLYAASAFGFAMFESYLHWRAGIGFHGLSCLVGPVHRNVIPLLAALALVAAALAEAVLHLVGWMRAAARELLRPRLLLPQTRATAGLRLLTLNPSRVPQRARSRAPPSLA